MKLMRQVKKKINGDDGEKSPRRASAKTTGTEKSVSSLSKSNPKNVQEIKTRNYDLEGDDPFSNLPTFREVPSNEHQYLFRKKLMACCHVYDFTTDTFQKEKEAKRLTLLEMVQHVNDTRNCFNEGLMQDVVVMTSTNIFRTLPPRRRWIPPFYDPEEEEATLEEKWPHLQIVYELFLRFVVCNDVDAKIAKRYIDGNFILKMVELIDSEDARERDYVKTILHRAYGKFMPLRTFVRRAIQHIFYTATYETYRHNGIAELLEILGSIINGFALPLKDEHRDFLLQSLIPLHKVKYLTNFHQPLSYCMTQYAEKDHSLVINIVESLFNYWPQSSTGKQLLFLNELEEILEMITEKDFLILKDAVFRQIAKCIGHTHFQVAERALFLWNNEVILKLLTTNKDTLYPVVINALYESSRRHWNSAVFTLTYNVLKLLAETDPELFDSCSKACNTQKDKLKKIYNEREEVWKLLIARFENAEEQGFFVAPQQKKSNNTKTRASRQSVKEGNNNLKKSPSKNK